MNHNDVADDVGCQCGNADEMLRKFLEAVVDDWYRMLLMMMLLMVNHDQHHQQNEARRKTSLSGCFFFIIRHVNPQPHQPHITGKPLPSSITAPPSSWVTASPAASLSSPPSSIAAPPSQPTASSWLILNYSINIIIIIIFSSSHTLTAHSIIMIHCELPKNLLVCIPRLHQPPRHGPQHHPPPQHQHQHTWLRFLFMLQPHPQHHWLPLHASAIASASPPSANIITVLIFIRQQHHSITNLAASSNPPYYFLKKAELSWPQPAFVINHQPNSWNKCNMAGRTNPT